MILKYCIAPDIIWFCIEDWDWGIIFLNFLRPICFCSAKIESNLPGVPTRCGRVCINSIKSLPVTQSPKLSIHWSDRLPKPPAYRVICQNAQTTVSPNNRQYLWWRSFQGKCNIKSKFQKITIGWSWKVQIMLISLRVLKFRFWMAG